MPTDAPLVTDHYGWWIIGADLVSLYPLTQWMVDADKFYFAMPTLFLGPIVHAAHGEIPTAAGSLLMRGAALGVTYLAFESAKSECANTDEFVCVPVGSIMLATLAYVSATAIDATFLAKRTRRAEGWDRLPVQPSFGMAADGRKWLTFGGTF